MILRSRATLGLYSDEAASAEVTRILGITPDACGEKGEVKNPASSTRHTFETSAWIYSPPITDEGWTNLEALIDLLEEKKVELHSLRKDYVVEVAAIVSTDGWEHSFVLPAGLMERLGRLGLDLAISVWDDSPE